MIGYSFFAKFANALLQNASQVIAALEAEDTFGHLPLFGEHRVAAHWMWGRDETDPLKPQKVCGKCFDLLNRKKPVQVMEDEHGQQQLVGLQWVSLTTAESLLELLDRSDRTTKATAQNAHSSRSHAILQIAVVTPAPQPWQPEEQLCKAAGGCAIGS